MEEKSLMSQAVGLLVFFFSFSFEILSTSYPRFDLSKFDERALEEVDVVLVEYDKNHTCSFKNFRPKL